MNPADHDERERRMIDPAVAQMLSLMSTTIEEMRKAVTKLTDGYEMLQRIIFGSFNEETNQRVPGVLDRLDDGKKSFADLSDKIDRIRTERVETEQKIRRFAYIFIGVACIPALRAVGVPTDKIGELISFVLKFATGV